MEIIKAPLESIEQLSEKTYLIKIYCPELEGRCYSGQFANIKVSNSDFPLLRRPFSLCNYQDGHVYFMFDVHGEGTKMLADKKEGDIIDMIIPLGEGFKVEGDYDTAVILGGGIGVAPFPYVTDEIPDDKEIITLIGGRTSTDVITYGLKNVEKATDDGSEGFHGNVLELFKTKYDSLKDKKLRIFVCGPTPMLRAVKEFCDSENLDCQISTECAMACGYGICQGCNCESTENKEKYMLVCKDGPVFNSKDVII